MRQTLKPTIEAHVSSRAAGTESRPTGAPRRDGQGTGERASSQDRYYFLLMWDWGAVVAY